MLPPLELVPSSHSPVMDVRREALRPNEEVSKAIGVNIHAPFPWYCKKMDLAGCVHTVICIKIHCHRHIMFADLVP